MSTSMYRLTVPMFQRGLTTLKNYLEKAEAYAKEKGIDPNELVAARLAPDMLPLSGQYQRASDSAKLAVARLTATEAPKFEDSETTIAELRERIGKTEAYLATIAPQALEGTETNEVTIAPGGNKMTFRGDEYVATFALPNFYFHVATAHAILRNQGVPVGKIDYLGRFS
ncbi:DUF1993 domain-containing protein [Rhizobium sp. SEMIA 4085]|uniref:DUF1993 domain-containing protein n=1 Tax=Rhizobium gallicum bv. gallicum R602sp TaxID=1041138 RepID=A0A0B4X981_9HYPH|nr:MULTISPECIES: DUF1993 domain-containing protein [Rhizobium]AJD43275.1 hypothetical protein RGR602_CH03978 [Rhizobium gallicum bv. gallicum R602sp]NNH27985.1 DUF1993 domain-containing protein [Rhizobium sp. SEMIA 4085]